MKHLPFIDGLRAAAVLPVILFHFGLSGFSGGYVGVDVFFVISGFLITGLIFEQMKQGKFSILHFYERRARRILPALFVTAILALAAALALFMPEDFRMFAKSLKGLAVFGANFVFARDFGYFAGNEEARPLLHTWSLAVEEQFYLLFPLLLYALHSRSAKKLRMAAYAVLAVSLVLNLALIHVSPTKTFYLLHTRAWELMAGAVLALHLRDIKLSRAAKEAIGAAGALLLVLCVMLYNRETVFPGAAAIAPVLATVFLIWANLDGVTATGKVLAHKIPVAIGLVSYGLYLYHWPVFVFLRYYQDRAPNAVEIAMALAGIALASIASYVFIEKPVRSGAVLESRRKVFAFSGAGLALMFAIALAGVKTDGFPHRFSGEVLAYALGAKDTPPEYSGCKLVLPEKLNRDTVCKAGVAKDRPDFLLWGDSHASAFAPALRRLIEARGLSAWFVTYSGCPPLSNVRRTDDRIDMSCLGIGDAVIKLVRDNSIGKVLIVSRWDMYALGGEKGGVEEARPPAIEMPLPGGEVLGGREAFKQSFDETMQALAATGAKLWIVKQAPPHLEDVPTALAKAVYLGRDPLALNRPYQDVMARRSFIDETFAKAAGKYGLSFLDPVPAFCPQRKACLASIDGHALYSDNNHVSVYGALWAKDIFTPFLDSLH